MTTMTLVMHYRENVEHSPLVRYYSLNGDKYVVTYGYAGTGPVPRNYCIRCGCFYDDVRDLDIHFFGRFCDYEILSLKEMQEKYSTSNGEIEIDERVD